jgi:branched-subunit amino acid aminotransferase/4-amino-4-deoxychorismate lyase
LGETNIPPEALFGADEVFFTSSIRGIVPVTQVNGKPIGTGRRGPLTQRFQALYLARVEAECGGGGSGQKSRWARNRQPAS